MSSLLDTQRLAHLLGSTPSAVTAVGGGDICDAYKVELDNGPALFVKTRADAPSGFFHTEAAGLRSLATVDGDGVPVPTVRAVDDLCLVLDWIRPGLPSAASAERFGRALAATHRSGGDVFGSNDGDGWIGTLPLPAGPWSDWQQMWAAGRIEPYVRMAWDRDVISKRDVLDIERLVDALPELCGPAEPPSLIHGDLWAGNIMWGEDGRTWLVDPAAHGGHRETDLAMLTLFGLPHLDHVLASYHEAWPLADGWEERRPIHQLHPVLVHAVLFGGSYGPHAGRLARQALGSG